ncbi:MAG: glycoside hydrolase [Tannerella sp.]|nr:glycoside hydrolase [Tannerella sp.]
MNRSIFLKTLFVGAVIRGIFTASGKDGRSASCRRIIKRTGAGICIILSVCSCKPALPITSSITIDLEKLTQPVNSDLYGLSLEEINHAIDGGLYAEQIRNRGFEEGILPAGCLYDASGRHLITPAGWKVPFVPPDVVPGWHMIPEHTYWYLNVTHPVNEKSNRSLGVRVDYSGKGGGVVAEGFHGIGIRKGEQYDLSFYLRGGSYAMLNVGLRDSTALHPLSDVCRLHPPADWGEMRYTFTATEDAPKATLVFSADSGLWFYLDQVSLFPRKTWKDRPEGLRQDLTEALAALHPRFIRFPGGSFVEGYSMESLPQWNETIGPAAERKPVWSIWGYATTNGVGFHEYLQLCEDLDAKPVYVSNAGVLNQRYRLRYEEIQKMDMRAKHLTDAVAYATEPVDSLYGRMRAANGHPQPFNLNTVELGNRNQGIIYAHRYQYLRKALKERYPDLLIIGTDTIATKKGRSDWTDMHCLADPDFLITAYNCFDVENLSIRTPMIFIGEFGASHSPDGGTLRAAVGEAAFLTGVERNPFHLKGIAFSPLLGNLNFPLHGHPAIGFDANHVLKTPSYHVLEMFAGNRGDELLVTNVQTFRKPLIMQGRLSVVSVNNAFEIADIKMDDRTIPAKLRKDERTVIRHHDRTQEISTPHILSTPEMPDQPETADERTERRHLLYGRSTSGLQSLSEDERRTCLVAGDSAAYNYTFSARIRRTQTRGKIQLQVRDNGLVEEAGHRISWTLADRTATLYYCAGSMERPLAPSIPLPMEDARWYTVRMVCFNEKIRCYLDDVLLTEADVPLSPSLTAVATRESATNTILLKVVNTTYHEEWTSLHLVGGHFSDDAEIICLTGTPDGRNTPDNPSLIVPQRKQVRFSFRHPITYAFPANSVTVFRWKLKPH